MSDVPPTPPPSGEPAWLPDPSGRHQLRWWDGTQYTDAVADAGTTSTDPIVPAAGPAPTPAPSPAPPADGTGRKASTLPVVLAVAGAALVVIALVVLLGGDDGDGTGQFAGEVTDDEEGRHEVSIDGGSVLVVEVEPEGDFDPIVGFEVSDEAEERIEELFEDTPLEGTVDLAILEFDSGGDGDDETAFIPLPFDADAVVVVRGFEGSEGSYAIRLESFDVEVDDDGDIVEMIEAVAESDDVPRQARRIAEDLLELIQD